ncbi:[acyl-carrier-protein] S-malonyltransferase [Alkalithermobacter thermoalcaliphilus JW-YL-7 = DSM 7308]|uniref:Malonyl CoA-acyl carrier protein transacylase n=1 Tax=Alkalithermobacter thermoalcaliphilus JW-YL-7 = DSM 7308 TaxID=1121328 RepID=A0A150FPY5_CLOPD|nr:malonyl CoA-acyl carrier protein transacylase [[Clostridium] paradoxum JW-YL-7 = DSM 7308]SHK95317.1 [acyl-carrier-protein] S-malonyltransferase [[Clostridium] paradoxum JW-YL-7 = DSM 7308]
MKKVALVFPGQGAQYVGMGKQIYEKYEVARKIFHKSNEVLNVDLKSIIFEGPEEELTKTENTQPAILTLSVALLEVLKENINLKYDACAGLSLGEYSALVAADAISFEDAVSLVRKRGKFMQEAVPEGKGTMAAILGLDRNTLLKVLDEAKEFGVVEAANFNSPDQIVISGQISAVEKAVSLCKEKGAKKAVLLKVSAPFHSSMLIDAGENLRKELENISFNEPKAKVIANVNAKYLSKDNIKESLVKQVSSSVLWEDSVEKLINDGFDTFIEIGPGKTLKAFIKKIASNMKKDINIYNVEDQESLKQVINLYKGDE